MAPAELDPRLSVAPADLNPALRVAATLCRARERLGVVSVLLSLAEESSARL